MGVARQLAGVGLGLGPRLAAARRHETPQLLQVDKVRGAAAIFECDGVLMAVAGEVETREGAEGEQRAEVVGGGYLERDGDVTA